MKKIFVIGLLLATFSVHAQPIKKKLDSLLNYYHQTLDYNGVAFVAQKGHVLLNKGYGYKDWDKRTLTDENSMYMIGSITKQFTAEIILILARENKLGLQDKLDKYFPNYPSGNKITLEHLLTHTSGIHNYTGDTMWTLHPTTHVTHAHMLDIFTSQPLSFEPGSQFEYCNSNYVLLGYIIEKVTGKSYYTVVRETVLQPLGMTHTGFDYTHLKDKNKTVPYSHICMDTFYTDQIIDSTQSASAGALYSTAADMYKWHNALQHYKLLDKKWQDKAYVPHKDNYGYGWLVIDSMAGQHALYHSGAINGFFSCILRLDREDVFIILMKNVRFSGADNGVVAQEIAKCLYDANYKIPAPRKEIVLTDDMLKRYEGEYFMDSTMSIKFRVVNKALLMQVQGQDEDNLVAENETNFFSKTADAQFEFVKNESGGYKMILHQAGHNVECIKK